MTACAMTIGGSTALRLGAGLDELSWLDRVTAERSVFASAIITGADIRNAGDDDDEFDDDFDDDDDDDLDGDDDEFDDDEFDDDDDDFDDDDDDEEDDDL